MSIYDFKVKNIDGEAVDLNQYKGKVLLIVNTASKCGFTPQYKDLQKLYDKYNEKGFEILGFPCNQFAMQEPGNNKEVKAFCELNYGVSFPMFEKIDVRGKEAHPLFKYLTEKIAFKGLNEETPSGKMLYAFINENFPEFLIDDSIKWNFTKFLIDRDGNVINRFESPIEPMDIQSDIEKLL
ncbi:glutathione peroxidase [Clostridium sp. MSJ-4]|uniref:Glutathione peroxidase n=1 Tax=Clostridium simiarum TaxID=2841506 RepID=A0ABS6F0U3_9CLOT|nr:MULTISPECIES: glutathione peroxidase [Clostridium]MBU5592015.1 glutathione peroxidase [Clostridium simiarum]